MPSPIAYLSAMTAAVAYVSPSLPSLSCSSFRSDDGANRRKFGSFFKKTTTTTTANNISTASGGGASKFGTSLGRGGGGVFLSPPSNAQSEKTLDDDDTEDSFFAPEDVDYLWKMFAGSIGGGFAIKYGSVLFPDVTRPNLSLALTIIVAPVIISILILFKKSNSIENF